MTGAEPMAVAKKKTSISLILLMTFSVFSALVVVPNAAAIEQLDLAILSGENPEEDRYYPPYDGITFSVKVENQGFNSQSTTRVVDWYVCQGIKTTATCISNDIATGEINVVGLASGDNGSFSSGTSWYPSGFTGSFTVVFKFEIGDVDASDDSLSYNFNITDQFSDVAVTQGQDPRDTLTNLNSYDGELVLNTDQDYIMDIFGTAITCGSCELVAHIGWNLLSLDRTIVATANYSVTDLPAGGYEQPFTATLPALNFSTPGRYIFQFGLLNSTSTFQGDLFEGNNLAEIEIVLDNTLDLRVRSMYPSHDGNSISYYYGGDMVSVDIENIGNITVEDINVIFEVRDALGISESLETCMIDKLSPTESSTCLFDLNVQPGQGKTFRVDIPTEFNSRPDTGPSDNAMLQTTSVLAGDILPFIAMNSNSGIYTTADTIILTAFSNNVAPKPLTYYWTLETIIEIGTNQSIELNGSNYPLGEYLITLEITDALGTKADTAVTIRIIDEIIIREEPLMTGSAVSFDEAEFSYQMQLPVEGLDYNVGIGKEPLMLMEFKLSQLNNEQQSAQVQSIDLIINLSELLPDTIPHESVEIKSLPAIDASLWTNLQFPDQYVYDGDGNMSINLHSNMALLVVGSLPLPEISLDNLTYNKLAGGTIELTWETQGETDNPYLGGFKIFKLLSISQNDATFPDPEIETNSNVWEQLLSDEPKDSIPVLSDSWVDPTPLPTGTCASYAIVPSNRAGELDMTRIHVLMEEEGGSRICGDAIAPSTEISSFAYTYRFTNSSDCFNMQRNWNACYEVNLTWEWPASGEDDEVTWNMYRMDVEPSNVDLKLATPVETSLEGMPGEPGSFNQSGLEIDGIRPYRTYYYVLAPIDSSGNENTIDLPDGNILKVQIYDQWWDYNQHLIPEEPEPPEPPLGIQWLQDLLDYTEVDEFQTAGLAVILLVVLNALFIPVTIKRRARLKRVMAARKRNQATRNMADDFEEFFD